MSSNPRHLPLIKFEEMGKKFTKSGILHTWEAFPLAFVIGSAICGTIAFIGWQCNTREIQVNRRRKPINERVDLLNPRTLKLLVIENGPEPLPELHGIYQEMAEEKKQRSEEMESLRKLGKKKGKKQE